MNRGILAGRRVEAIKEIERKTGIDISRAALPKAPDMEHFQLFQLERLAAELGSASRVSSVEVMNRISAIKGVGPSLASQIVEELADLLPEAINSPQD